MKRSNYIDNDPPNPLIKRRKGLCLKSVYTERSVAEKPCRRVAANEFSRPFKAGLATENRNGVASATHEIPMFQSLTRGVSADATPPSLEKGGPKFNSPRREDTPEASEPFNAQTFEAKLTQESFSRHYRVLTVLCRRYL
jgi:hypothetical protein